MRTVRTVRAGTWVLVSLCARPGVEKAGPLITGAHSGHLLCMAAHVSNAVRCCSPELIKIALSLGAGELKRAPWRKASFPETAICWEMFPMAT